MAFLNSRRLGVAMVLVALAAAGCKSTTFLVPSPIIRDYDSRLPVTVGFLFTNEVRALWYHTQDGRERVDVPIGQVGMDFARASFQNAVEKFYIERYLDRRSQRGILIDMRGIRFDLTGTTASCTLDVVILDAANKEVHAQAYTGTASPEAVDMTILNSYAGESELEPVTAQAFHNAYQSLLADVRNLLGAQLAAAAAEATPAPEPAAPAPEPATPPAEGTPAPAP